MNDLHAQVPTCVHDAGTWCGQVYGVTHNEWLAASATWLVAKPLSILVIALVAFLAKVGVHHVISRLTTGRDSGTPPLLLRPLKERAPQALGQLVSERRAQRARTIGTVLRSLSSCTIYGLAFMQMLGQLGVELAPILASAGVVGVALGFGAQNLVKDFLSGMFMMLEDQYGVGDVIDLGSASGTVESVGLRVTTLRDVNGTVWYVRNGTVQRVGNSSQGFAVAVVDLPLGHTVNVERATVLIGRVADEATARAPLADDVIEPPEVLGVEEVTAGSITLRLTVKVRPGRQWVVQRALRAQLMTAFDEAAIEPFYAGPQPVN